MKKFLLLLALVIVGAMTNSVDARWDITGQKSASEIHVGDTIILEYCSDAQTLGKYLEGSRIQTSTGVKDEHIFVVEEGPADRRTGAPTIYLKSVELNGYLTFNGSWGTISYSASPENAANLQVLSCGEDIPWSNTVAWGEEGEMRPGHEGETAISNWRKNGGNRIATDESVGFSFSSSDTDWHYLALWRANYGEKGVMFWQYTDTNEWNVYGVTYVKALKDDLEKLIDSYLAEGEYVGGTDPAYYDADMAEEFNVLLQSSLALILGDTPDEEIIKAMADLKAAHARLVESQIQIEDGYYNLVSGYDDFLNNFGKEKAAYVNPNTNTLYYKDYDPADPAFVFYITKTDKANEFWMQDFLSDKYIGVPTNWYNATIPVTANKEEPAWLEIFKCGKFFWGSSTQHRTSYTPYAASAPVASDSEGKLSSWGQKSDPCTVDNNSNLWYLRKVTNQEMLDKFQEQKLQSERNEALANLIVEGQELYQNLFAYVTNFDDGLIVNASGGFEEDPADDNQITFSTIRKQGIPVADKYAYLIDKDSTTYMQGTGTIYVKLNSPQQTVTFVYGTRGKTDDYPNAGTWGMEERPAKVNLYGANVSEGDTEYGDPVMKNADFSVVGPKTINFGRPVDRIAYEVISNANGGSFFTLGEFQLYSTTIDETTSQYNTTPGLKEPADAMVAMLTAKRLIAAAGTAQDNDIAELKEAIQAVKALYADTTELKALIAEAQTTIDNTILGEGLGKLADEQLKTNLEAAVTGALNTAFVSPISAAAVQAATKAVTEALAAFKAGIATVEPGKWYFITNLDDKRTGDAGADDAACYGNAIYLKDKYAGTSVTKWGLYDAPSASLNADNNPKAMWRFVPVEGTSYFAVQNMYSGYYMGDYNGDNINLPVSETPVPYDIAYIGNAQFNLIPMGPKNKKKFALWPEGAENDVVCHTLDGTTSAWTFVEVVPEQQELITISDFAMNTMDVMAVPYNISGLADLNDDVVTYAVKKMSQEEVDGALVTTVELYRKDEFAAGEPFIIALGNTDENVEAEPYELIIPFPTEVIDHSVAMKANGIVGGLHSIGFENVTAISTGKFFKPMDAGSKFDAQTGVIDVMSYKGEVADVETALTLTITGLPALPGEGEHGDVDGDGEISSSDAIAVFNYIEDPENSSVDPAKADLDGDGNITSADAIVIYNIIAGDGAASAAFVAPGTEVSDTPLTTIIPAEENDKAILSIKVGDTNDLTKVPVIISLSNPEETITAIEVNLHAPIAPNKFGYDADEESYICVKNPDRCMSSHQPTLFAGTSAYGKDNFFISIVSTRSQNFKGTEGEICTVYMDCSGLADGEYDVTMLKSMAIWTDKKTTRQYKNLDVVEKFTIADGKATAVGSIDAENGVKAEKAIFTVDGKAVSAPQKGQIYIINGKAVKY